jgi:hypothetical protein
MNKTFNVALALAAGLLGGQLTHYIAPSAAFAQVQAPPSPVPGVPNNRPITKEIRAQSFTLVDQADHTVGTFTVEPAPLGRRDFKVGARIVLRDSYGREIWSAGGIAIQRLSER